jgi:AcrR family transcriptional regulator
MGVARRRDARARILEAAARLFYREGVRAVGVDRVVAEARVAKMSLYRHFPTKDALVLAFLEERDRRWRAWFEDRVARADGTLAGLVDAVFDALAAWFAERDFRGCAFVNSALELADPAHPAHVAARRHKEAVRAFLGRELARRRPGAAAERRLLDALVLLMEGAIVQAVLGDREAAERARAVALRLLDGPDGDTTKEGEST